MSAIISKCGHYRYRLDRWAATAEVGGSLTYAYFGINPSTADASLDDATVRKWIGFTRRNGGNHFIVGNVFAYRSTDVTKLRLAPDGNPIGPDNDRYLDEIIAEADILVPCWGNTGKVALLWRQHFTHVALKLMHSGKPVKIFGRTSSGDPKHPLMLGYDTPLVSAF